MKISERVLAEMQLVGKTIKDYIANNVDKDLEIIKQVSSHLIDAGGKRIRALLTILVARMFNYLGEGHIKLAAAVELIHLATLMHDDVIDNSKKRRSVDTTNKIWGNKVSILIGDFLFSQSFILMVEAGNLACLKTLSKASSSIVKGEVLQLSLEKNINLKEEEYLNVIKSKTAELFSAACKVSALLAGASRNEVLAMKEFGLNLGLIFQIQDDLLDYIADISVLGKNPGDDLLEGKVTLPIILLYASASKEEQFYITEVFHEPQKYHNSFEEIVKLLEKYNISHQVNNQIKNLYDHNIEILNSLPINNQFKDDLYQAIDFIYTRRF